MKEKRNNSTSWESTSWDSTNWEQTVRLVFAPVGIRTANQIYSLFRFEFPYLEMHIYNNFNRIQNNI